MSVLGLDPRGVRVACPRCGKVNRLAYARLGDPARCGGCGAELGPPAAPVEVPGAAEFDALVRESALPVLVDFWAPWCAPCRMVAPELERVAAARAGRALVAKVNTDALPDLGQRFGIRSIPTLAVFHRGRELARQAGAMRAPQIEAFLDAAAHSSPA